MTSLHPGLRIPFLIFRCYVRPDRERDEWWVAHCLDLSLSAGGRSPREARHSLSDAIEGYIETVFDTEDVGSIPRLLRRRAPLWKLVEWEIKWRLANWLSHGPQRAYEYTPPLHLGRATA